MKDKRLEVSNSDPWHFMHHHTRVSLCSDDVNVVWTIPDRLVRNEGLLIQILAELVVEFQEKAGLI